MSAPSGDPASSRPVAPRPLPGRLRAFGALLVVLALVTAGVLAWRRAQGASTDAAQRVSDVAADRSSAPSRRCRRPPRTTWTCWPRHAPTRPSRCTQSQRLSEVDRRRQGGSRQGRRGGRDHRVSRDRRGLERRPGGPHAEGVDRVAAQATARPEFASPEEADLASADEAVARDRLESLAQQREFEKLKVPFNGRSPPVCRSRRAGAERGVLADVGPAGGDRRGHRQPSRIRLPRPGGRGERSPRTRRGDHDGRARRGRIPRRSPAPPVNSMPRPASCSSNSTSTTGTARSFRGVSCTSNSTLPPGCCPSSPRRHCSSGTTGRWSRCSPPTARCISTT